MEAFRKMATVKILDILLALLVFVCCNAQGNQDLNCWALLSGAKPGKVRIADGVKGDKGANRFPPNFFDDMDGDSDDGRIPQMYGRPGLLMMETASYRAVLVAPPEEQDKTENFRTKGILEVTVTVGGETIGPIALNKGVPKKEQKALEDVGVTVQNGFEVNGKAWRYQLKFPDGDRVAADINDLGKGEFGAMVFKDDNSPMKNGVCGGPKYFASSANVEVSVSGREKSKIRVVGGSASSPKSTFVDELDDKVDTVKDFFDDLDFQKKVSKTRKKMPSKSLSKKKSSKKSVKESKKSGKKTKKSSKKRSKKSSKKGKKGSKKSRRARRRAARRAAKRAAKRLRMLRRKGKKSKYGRWLLTSTAPSLRG